MNDQLLQATSENPIPASCYARNAQRNPERIETQVRACRAYTDAHGLTIADEHIFVDDGASGANFDRPGWLAGPAALGGRRSALRVRPRHRAVTGLPLRGSERAPDDPG